MNYHTEHHMFPLVPYHQLPRLHAIVKDDCPGAVPEPDGRLSGDRASGASPAAATPAGTSAASCRQPRGR